MGFGMRQVASYFIIRKENLPATLQAIKELHGKETVKLGPKHHFRYANPDFYKAETIDKIFKDWRWTPSFNEEGDLDDLQFRGEKLGDEEILFKQIAPFVEHGCDIEMTGDNDARWVWAFENGEFYERSESF